MSQFLECSLILSLDIVECEEQAGENVRELVGVRFPPSPVLFNTVTNRKDASKGPKFPLNARPNVTKRCLGDYYS